MRKTLKAVNPRLQAIFDKMSDDGKYTVDQVYEMMKVTGINDCKVVTEYDGLKQYDEIVAHVLPALATARTTHILDTINLSSIEGATVQSLLDGPDDVNWVDVVIAFMQSKLELEIGIEMQDICEYIYNYRTTRGAFDTSSGITLLNHMRTIGEDAVRYLLRIIDEYAYMLYPTGDIQDVREVFRVFTKSVAYIMIKQLGYILAIPTIVTYVTRCLSAFTSNKSPQYGAVCIEAVLHLGGRLTANQQQQFRDALCTAGYTFSEKAGGILIAVGDTSTTLVDDALYDALIKVFK